MKNVLFTLLHGKAVLTTQKVYSESKVTVVQDVVFKGRPDLYAALLIQKYTAGGALGFVDNMGKTLPLDTYWKNVHGYVMRAINGKPAAKHEKVALQ